MSGRPSHCQPLRVLLAEDHVLVRVGLRKLLESVAWIQVICEVSDGPTALAEAQRLQPDVAIVGVGLPYGHGVRTALAIRQFCPATRVLLVSAQEDPAYLRQSMAAGVHGFVVKRAAERDLLRALGQIAKGKRFFPAPLRTRPDPIL